MTFMTSLNQRSRKREGKKTNASDDVFHCVSYCFR